MGAVAEGHYYRKQLGCKSGIIAWSHRSRFLAGLRLIGSTPRKLLDYGCGDGTFLAMAADRVREGWGADLAADQIRDCRGRLASFANLRFCTTDELAGGSHDAAYDVVTCMETLEHCTAPVVEVVLRDLARLVSTDGRVLISVPVEIGPSFLLKLVIRKAAGWRGLSDYRSYESYSPRDAFRMVFAGRNSALDRPRYGEPDAPWHSHYGFNWRALRERVRDHLTVERTVFTPLGFLGGWVSSQAWFVCRPRASASRRPQE
ncbi:MAG: class I SAM-dependent methyltransferase [Planctomycetia bacterium]|nr:class I SAM-dependent methyltransferase [Planctomycetia bacterium]